MLSLPERPTETIKLADWLELSALTAPDLNASSGDLQTVLRRAALFDRDGDEAIQLKVQEVFTELEQRVRATGDAYPFSVHAGVLEAQPNWNDYPSYVFCLCLSYFGWRGKIGGKVFPQRLFEDLCCAAAQKYLHGGAVRFASPRRHLPRSFGDAVTAICMEHIKEGIGFKTQPTFQSKDYRVDVIAWRHFPDHLPGKLLLFGGCASGENWDDKLDEVQPDAFCSTWMIEVPVSSVIRAFFIPHRVDFRRWSMYSRRAGIIFDRCRIALWTHGRADNSTANDLVSFHECLDWSKHRLKERVG